jgi:hypothetical protein
MEARIEIRGGSFKQSDPGDVRAALPHATDMMWSHYISFRVCRSLRSPMIITIKVVRDSPL